MKISEPLICPVCGEAVDELHLKRSPRCWGCLTPKQRNNLKWRERQQELGAKRAAENRDLLAQFKAERGCEICGEVNPVMLDFHHLDPSQKSFNIGPGATRSIESLRAEVAKCVILCANHHREFHHLYGASPVPSDFTSYREQYSQENHEQ